MRMTFNGRGIEVNGKPDTGQGLPKKPVFWTGEFMVANSEGHAVQAKWLPRQNPKMTYREAKEMAFRLMETLCEQLEAEHSKPIKKVAFTLIGR